MKKYWSIVILLCVLSILIHLIPFALNGSHPLGYDTGFYRRYVIQPFVSFPNSPVPGLGKDALGPRLLIDTIRLLHVPPDIILYGTYILLFAVQVWALFFLTTYYWGIPTGLAATLLFVLSVIQYTAYWFMLFKNAFATAIMLITFLLMEKKSRWTVIGGMLIAASHHTTAIIFLLTLIVYFIINRQERKRTLLIFMGTLAVFLFFHIFAYQTYIRSPVAMFVEWREYVFLSFPLLVLALFGVKYVVSQRKSVFTAFVIIAIMFPLFSLPFYQRVFIFTDIAIIMIGALGLASLIKEAVGLVNHFKKTARIVSLCIMTVITVLLLTNLSGRINALRPLVSKEILKKLGSITRHVQPNGAIMTSTTLAPWVHGWSQNKIIAPGLLHDTRDIQQWISFWNGSRENKINFLKNFPRPLYFFLSPPEKEKFMAHIEECVRQASPFLFQYTCD